MVLLRSTIAVLVFFLFSPLVFAQGFVYPVGNPNERPTTIFPNLNGYKISQGFMNKDDHTGVDLANGTEGGEVRSIGSGIVSLRRETAGARYQETLKGIS